MQEIRPKKSTTLIALALLIVGSLVLMFSIVNLTTVTSPETYFRLTDPDIRVEQTTRMAICSEKEGRDPYHSPPALSYTFTDKATGESTTAQSVGRQSEYSLYEGGRVTGVVLATVRLEPGEYEVTVTGITDFDKLGDLVARKDPTAVYPAVALLVGASLLFVGSLVVFIVIHRRRKKALRALAASASPVPPAGYPPQAGYPGYPGEAPAGYPPQNTGAATYAPPPAYPAYPGGVSGYPAQMPQGQVQAVPNAQGQYPWPAPQAAPGTKAPPNPGTKGYFVWSIVNTCCFAPLVLPIFALVQAVKARRAPTPELVQHHKKNCLQLNLATYGVILGLSIANGIVTTFSG